MDQDDCAQGRRSSVANDSDADIVRPSRHSPVHYASSEGVGDRDVLYTGEPRRRLDRNHPTAQSNNDVVGMSLCTVDAADMSYIDLPTPRGSGDCIAGREVAPTRRIDPTREREYAVFREGLQAQRSGRVPPLLNRTYSRCDELQQGGHVINDPYGAEPNDTKFASNYRGVALTRPSNSQTPDFRERETHHAPSGVEHDNQHFMGGRPTESSRQCDVQPRDNPTLNSHFDRAEYNGRVFGRSDWVDRAEPRDTRFDECHREVVSTRPSSNQNPDLRERGTHHVPLGSNLMADTILTGDPQSVTAGGTSDQGTIRL